jgi:hypothetical protein
VLIRRGMGGGLALVGERVDANGGKWWTVFIGARADGDGDADVGARRGGFRH